MLKRKYKELLKENHLSITIIVATLLVLARFSIYGYPDSLVLLRGEIPSVDLYRVLRALLVALSLVGAVMIFAGSYSTKKIIATLAVLAIFYTALLVPFGVLLRDSTPHGGSDGFTYLRIARYVVDNKTLKLEQAPFWMGQSGFPKRFSA